MYYNVRRQDRTLQSTVIKRANLLLTSCLLPGTEQRVPGTTVDPLPEHPNTGKQKAWHCSVPFLALHMWIRSGATDPAISTSQPLSAQRPARCLHLACDLFSHNTKQLITAHLHA